MCLNLSLAVHIDACYAVVRGRMLPRRTGSPEPGQCAFAAGNARSCVKPALAVGAGARVRVRHRQRVGQSWELAASWFYLMCLKFPC